ncbi:MAG: hypothetical protein SCI25_07445 [Desulfuromonadales bacterium]|nr:hypothetical protein [Desulfuromonadales bacterium]MDW7644861.1 hypothetical protein [Desulfuromonadales bacterium]MDW7758566.1 hypothetical protein [Desulfuromonadales bacterium]
MTITTAQLSRKVEPEHFKKLLTARLKAMERGTGVNPYQGSEMLRIRFALNRIHMETHLECVKCKGAIAEKRLLANPAVLTCGRCEPGSTI